MTSFRRNWVNIPKCKIWLSFRGFKFEKKNILATIDLHIVTVQGYD